jgi:hypothetical protein
VWILRRGISGSTFGGGEADQLPARGALGLAAKAAVDQGHADAVTGFRTEAIERDTDDRLVLVGEDSRRLDPVDEVIMLAGFRPDLSCKGRPSAARAAKRPQDFGVIHRRLVGQQAGDRLDGVAQVLAAAR